MKKAGALILFLLLIGFISFAYSQSDMPSTGFGATPGEEDVHKIQNLTGKIPIGENGKLNTTAMIGWKSKAEVRIDKINAWLKKYASWFRLVFGMVPEISWLFAIVLYWWLLCFVNLVMNGDIFGIFLSNKNTARILGVLIFILLLVPLPPAIEGSNKSIIYRMGNFVYHLADITWNWIIPYGMALAIIVLVIFIVVLVVLAIFAPKWLFILKKKMEEHREKKKLEEQHLDQQVLHKTVEGIEEGQG